MGFKEQMAVEERDAFKARAERAEPLVRDLAKSCRWLLGQFTRYADLRYLTAEELEQLNAARAVLAKAPK